MKEVLVELERRRAESRLGVGQTRIDAQHLRGNLTASDRYGRVIGEATTSREHPVTVVTDLGMRGGGTIYTRIGEAFAWLCVVLSVAFAAWRIRRRA